MRPRRTAAAVILTLLAVTAGACSTEPERRPVTPAPTTGAPPGGAPRSSGPPVGEAPDRPFAVGLRELRVSREGRPLPISIWYPAAGRAGGSPEQNLRPAAGRFPVVLFSHGLTARPGDYQRLLAGWTAAGFVVAAPRYPYTSRDSAEINVLDVLNQPADASYALTRVLDLDRRDGDPLRGRLATDRVAAAGHSAGGVTTVGLFTAGRDDRLDAGIVLAGSALGVGTAFAGSAAPQLFVHGQRDDVVSYAAGRAAYEAVPWPKAMLSLPDGDHGGSLTRVGNRAFPVVATSTADFLRWTLYGDQAARERLPRDAVRGGLATLDDRL
ncbi:alpha/beta hydrolase family protein [Plantactinospora sp. GCM10030261]|uniref:alpha/beta hydrolase family protein n=1 Tax=Plantactinospora sp. GCM10030261 TaxID=3273420 RepID=UPI003620AD07